MDVANWMRKEDSMVSTRILSGLAAAIFGVGLAVPSAHAVSINTCQSDCSGLSPATVATVTIAQNGPNVDFTLINSVSNLGLPPAAPGTFISRFLLNYTGSSLALSDFTKTDFSAVGGAGSFSAASGRPTGLSFNLEIGLPTSNGGGGTARFTNGETLMWRVANDSTSNFSVAPDAMMVHIQALANGGSTWYVNGVPVSPDPVPEPASLLLLGSGLAGLALWRRNSGKV